MTTLGEIAREAGGRIIASLAARFRDLEIAEEAYADACARAAERWPVQGEPDNPAAWLYRSAERRALDLLRRRRVRLRHSPEPPPPEPTAEDLLMDDAQVIPDDRLRLIFVCCHPAIAAETRAALTLKLVCGLSSREIATAFLLQETTLLQRLLRAKRKIATAGIPYAVPGPEAWPERLDAVLSTLEIAYAKAHEDAAGGGRHAGFADEILRLTSILAELMPTESQVLAFAALTRYAEARRAARLDESGAMVPLSEQDPAQWRPELIAEGDGFLKRAAAGRPHARILEAAIHGVWCGRTSLNEPPPWPAVLGLYDTLLLFRNDPIVRLNRAVAVAEVEGPGAALTILDGFDADLMTVYAPYWALRADLFRRLGRNTEARTSYHAALALGPPPAERLWLERQEASLARH